MKKVSTALLAVPLATAMLLLAGCSGDDKPNASESSRVSSTPTSTSTQARSTPSDAPTSRVITNAKIDRGIPAEARVASAAGAEAFVRYFVKQWNVAWTGPRAGILSPLCHPSSDACAVYEKTATQLRQEGHHYNGDPVTIKSVKITAVTKARMADLLTVMVQEPRSEVDKAGKVYRTEKRKEFGARFVLLHNGGTWSVSFIQSAK
jgi:hypothetical protein